MMTPTSAPRRNARVVARNLNGTTILLHLDTGQFYELEAVGARIWELCDGHRSLAEVVALLAEEYDAPLDTIHADTRELLADLDRERLVDLGQ